jgi:hypothetical protein
MIRILCLGALLAVISFLGCSSKQKTKIVVMEETLGQAKEHGFDYCAALARAEQGDRKAITQLLRFSNTDAAGSLGHILVVTELLLLVGDEPFAAAADELSAKQKQRVRQIIQDGFLEMELTLSFEGSFPKTQSALR